MRKESKWFHYIESKSYKVLEMITEIQRMELSLSKKFSYSSMTSLLTESAFTKAISELVTSLTGFPPKLTNTTISNMCLTRVNLSVSKTTASLRHFNLIWFLILCDLHMTSITNYIWSVDLQSITDEMFYKLRSSKRFLSNLNLCSHSI